MGKVLTKYLFLISAIITGFLVTGCSEEGCTDPRVSYTAGNVEAENLESTINVNGFSIWGIGQATDSAMVTNGSISSPMELLLNSNSDVTQLKFDFYLTKDTVRDTISDIITFYYENQDFFLSMDCGCTVYHFIDSITTTNNFILKTEIVNPEVTNEKKINFNLYY